ncbi:MAG: amino acid permease [Acidobacteriales bacterium]|nr:amino acid permease [Terriglobales bacterium]
MAATGSTDQHALLRKTMGLWDVVLFNIAAVLGPRWIARAAHNGESSLTLWVLAAFLFFLPTALIIVELSSRYPHEGGIYVWTKEAFGDFHGFVAGWCYWVYTLLYFPGLLTASVAMSAYIGGAGSAWLADNKTYIIAASIVTLLLAAGLNLVGLNIGKWLQNAGGVGTYVPLVMLLMIAGVVWMRFGTQNAIDPHKLMPKFDLDTVNFWSGIAFAFTGMELVCSMSEEVKDTRRTMRRAIYISGILIAVIYILGTVAVLSLINPAAVNTQNGVFQAITHGSTLMGVAWIGVIAALMVTAGNAGGVGATVAGVSRIPFVVGIDRYLPAAFGKLHPTWRTPYVAILVQAALSAAVLVLANLNETISGAYEVLINATIIVYFIPFMYMYAAAIKLAYRPDRDSDPHVALVPGGKVGIWLAGALGLLVTAVSIVLSLVPSADVTDKSGYFLKVFGGTVVSVSIGLTLYFRGKLSKAASAIG